MANLETIRQSESKGKKTVTEQIKTLDQMSFSNHSSREREHWHLSAKEMRFLRTATPEEFIQKMLEDYDPTVDESPYNFERSDAFNVNQVAEDDYEIYRVCAGLGKGRRL